MEKMVVQQDSMPEPVGSPAPSEAAPQAPAAAEIQTKIDAWQERKSDVDAGIKKRRVVTIDAAVPKPKRGCTREHRLLRDRQAEFVSRFGRYRFAWSRSPASSIAASRWPALWRAFVARHSSRPAAARETRCPNRWSIGCPDSGASGRRGMLPAPGRWDPNSARGQHPTIAGREGRGYAVTTAALRPLQSDRCWQLEFGSAKYPGRGRSGATRFCN